MKRQSKGLQHCFPYDSCCARQLSCSLHAAHGLHNSCVNSSLVLTYRTVTGQHHHPKHLALACRCRCTCFSVALKRNHFSCLVPSAALPGRACSAESSSAASSAHTLLWGYPPTHPLHPAYMHSAQPLPDATGAGRGVCPVPEGSHLYSRAC